MDNSAYYSEKIYFTEGDAKVLLARNQRKIVDVLTKNNAVGVVGGFYRDGYPVYFISEFMLSNLGYSYEEFMEITGGRYSELVYDKDRESFQRSFNTINETKMEYRLINNSGETVWVNEIKKESVSINGLKIWIAAVRLIDDVHRRETELLNALGEEYESIIYYDMRKKNFEWIKRSRILIYEQPIGRLKELENIFDNYLKYYVHPEDIQIHRLFITIENILNGESSGENKYQATYRSLVDDKYKWMQACVIFGGSISTDTGYMVLGFRNVDEHIRKELDSNKLLSDSLERTKKANMAKKDFLSKMSHDIRTPLNGIIGTIELAENTDDIQKIKKEYLPVMSSVSNHLLQIFDEVLDMNEIENGDISVKDVEINIKDVINEITDVVLPEFQMKKQELKVNYENVEHYDVYGDAQILQKIFYNLLSNASRYSYENSVIIFNIKEVNQVRKDYAYYEYKVIDDGIGIEKAMIKKIFEPFERVEDTRISKVPYVGLGLTITKNLVEILKGNIEVDSELGKGSCFTVTLEMRQQHNEKENEQYEYDIKGIRVLLVEDNLINMEVTKQILCMEGVEVETAENGYIAVNTFKQHENGYYDAILMDIRMPVMDGYTATGIIRTLTNIGGDVIPIIAVTSDAYKEDVKKALQSGMNGHVKKALGFGELKKMLYRFIHQQGETK